MELNGKHLILASNSPRRRELLAGLGIEFEVDTKNNFEEVVSGNIEAEDIPAFMSRGKSHGFHRQLKEGEILLTSDTLVLCSGKVMGKPHSRKEAFDMLRMLSGREHKVITAVTLRDCYHEITESDTALVHFKELSDDEINYYIDNYKPFDKAGAYGIQEWIGYIGIGRIEGSFFTIMGLPVHLVYSLLSRFN